MTTQNLCFNSPSLIKAIISQKSALPISQNASHMSPQSIQCFSYNIIQMLGTINATYTSIKKLSDNVYLHLTNLYTRLYSQHQNIIEDDKRQSEARALNGDKYSSIVLVRDRINLNPKHNVAINYQPQTTEKLAYSTTEPEILSSQSEQANMHSPTSNRGVLELRGVLEHKHSITVMLAL